ncbi:MAG: dTDP-4-dehydrorhamnose 3,5-epimerase [Pseudomonadota bacterium]
MKNHSLNIPEIREIIPDIHRDSRGFFSEVYNENTLHDLGVDIKWVQDNHSVSTEKGVLRGLHFQIPPFDQDKLVRVIHGSILDVVVDIRNGSPSFGQHVCLVVSKEKWNQILVPKGFAHGFVTLEPDTEVIYKVSAPYSKEHDRVIRYDDPDLAIDWQFEESELSMSKKDAAAPRLRDQDTGFRFETKGQLV